MGNLDSAPRGGGHLCDTDHRDDGAHVDAPPPHFAEFLLPTSGGTFPPAAVPVGFFFPFAALDDMTTEHDNAERGRARSVSPLGKLTKLEQTKVDERTHLAWLAHCAELEVDPAMELRNMIYTRLYAKTYEQMVAEQQQHDAHRRALLRLDQASVGNTDGNLMPGAH